MTVGEVVWDRASKSRVVPLGKETAPFLREQRRQHVRLTKEAVWWFLSRSVEHHHPNSLLYVSHPESGWAPFWVRFHAQRQHGLETFKFHKLIYGHTAKCWAKGRNQFYFFCPHVSIKFCVEAPQIGM